MNPRIAGVRLSMLLHLYVVRLRSHAVQELLAASGIAVGVALVLGVLVANASITSSAGELIDQVVGSARLQLAARSPEGFEQSSVPVSSLPGVSLAASLLRENVAVVGPRGRASVQLLGFTPALLLLGGFDAHQLIRSRLSSVGGVILPANVAASTGVKAGERVTVLARGGARSVRVSMVLSGTSFGALASSPVVVALLPVAQQLTGLRGRVTQVLIKPHPGDGRKLARELRRSVGSHLEVTGANNELRLLDAAAKPNDESTSLFAAISVMVGFLLALNAMLLTVPERRRFVADLRMQGYDWRQILVLLGFQAVVLGLFASAIGVVVGDVLARALFHRIPTYLTTAFPIGNQETLHVSAILLALGCGVLATILASFSPVLDLRPDRPTDAVLRDRTGTSEAIAQRTAVKLLLAGAVSLVLITVLVLSAPSLTIFGGVGLAVGVLCLVPSVFLGVSRALRWAGERVRSSALIVVVSELRAVTMRSVALAGIAALAVYGSVAIGGARADLLRGLNANFDEYLRTADVWVTTGGNDLTTNPFVDRGASAAIARSPDVAAVRSYMGSFLDVGSRRMWIIGRPAHDSPLIPASQLLAGNPPNAASLLRSGRWAAVSAGFAGEHHLRVGERFSLPTPSGGAEFGVAAITTNLGWSPGAVIIDAAAYQRYWQSGNPSALEVELRPGVSAQAGRRAVRQALGDRPGLGVQTFAERRAQYAKDSRQGLQALSQISSLLLIAAALAVASALSAAIWQRRARLASLKIQGYATGQLWRALLLESTIVLGVGCVIGALAGVYGHALASRWLRITTGFPAPFAVNIAAVALTLALLALIALAVIAAPGLVAARAPARVGIQE